MYLDAAYIIYGIVIASSRERSRAVHVELEVIYYDGTVMGDVASPV